MRLEDLSDLVAELPFDVRRLVQVPALRRVHEETGVRRALALWRLPPAHEVKAAVVLQLAPPPPPPPPPGPLAVGGRRARPRPRLFVIDAGAPDRATLYAYMRGTRTVTRAGFSRSERVVHLVDAVCGALVQQHREVSLWVWTRDVTAPPAGPDANFLASPVPAEYRLVHHRRLVARRRDSRALADELAGMLAPRFAMP